MKMIKYLIATTEVILLLPGVLFLTALFLRELQPAQYEPAHTARRLVDWFSLRPLLGLDVFLVALPLTAFVIGCAAVLRAWRGDAAFRRFAVEALAAVRSDLATLVIAGATVVAGGILAIVAIHMITE